MPKEIVIAKKSSKGDDGHKILSVRLKDEIISRLDKLAIETNRSRNELINIILEKGLDIVKITDPHE